MPENKNLIVKVDDRPRDTKLEATQNEKDLCVMIGEYDS